MVILSLLCLLLFPVSAHTLIVYDVSLDLTSLAGVVSPDGPWSFAIDNGENEGATDPLLHVYNITFGTGGRPIDDLNLSPGVGNLRDGFTLHHNGSGFLAAFVPSPTDPLRFRFSMGEEEDQDSGTYAEIAFFIAPLNAACFEPCTMFMGIFGNQARAPGTPLWNVFPSWNWIPDHNTYLPAPILTNVAFAENPEPSTIFLMSSGLLLIVVLARSPAAFSISRTAQAPPSPSERQQ